MSQKNEAKLADLRLSDIRCDRPTRALGLQSQNSRQSKSWPVGSWYDSITQGVFTVLSNLVASMQLNNNSAQAMPFLAERTNQYQYDILPCIILNGQGICVWLFSIQAWS